VRGGGVTKAGDDRKTGEEYRMGEVGGVGVRVHSFESTSSGLRGISPVFFKEIACHRTTIKDLISET